MTVEAASCKVLWSSLVKFSASDFIPFESELFLSPNAESVVVIRRRAFHRWSSEKALADVELVYIYNKGKLLQSHTVGSLGIDEKLIMHSPSNIHAFVEWHSFREPLYIRQHDKGRDQHILFGGDETEAFATFRDGQRITFCLKTGKTKKREKLQRLDGKKNAPYGDEQ